MERRFAVAEPEQLRELGTMAKAGSVSSVAAVWRAARVRGGGKCAWDGRVTVEFRSGRTRKTAAVVRLTSAGERDVVAWLKYSLALSWCRENLWEEEP